MFKITLMANTLFLVHSLVQAGFSGSQLSYNSVYSAPLLPFAAEQQYNTAYGSTYAVPYNAPLPVAASTDHYPPAGAVAYFARPVVKFRSAGSNSGGRFGCAPFNNYPTVRSHNKFAFPAPVAAVYNAPPPVTLAAPPVTYSAFDAPNTVVKFGPPITTTTTTYSTAAAASHVPVGNPLNAVAAW